MCIRDSPYSIPPILPPPASRPSFVFSALNAKAVGEFRLFSHVGQEQRLCGRCTVRQAGYFVFEGKSRRHGVRLQGLAGARTAARFVWCHAWYYITRATKQRETTIALGLPSLRWQHMRHVASLSTSLSLFDRKPGLVTSILIVD